MLNNLETQTIPARRRHRTYTAQFKAELVAQCMAPGVSIAALAGSRGMNVNVLHRWLREFERGGAHRLGASGHTRTDNSAVMLSLVQHGVGIGRLMDLLALTLVAGGALVPLMREHFDSPRIPIYAVMLQERHRLPKIRACIDYWAL